MSFGRKIEYDGHPVDHVKLVAKVLYRFIAREGILVGDGVPLVSYNEARLTIV